VAARLHRLPTLRPQLTGGQPGVNGNDAGTDHDNFGHGLAPLVLRIAQHILLDATHDSPVGSVSE